MNSLSIRLLLFNILLIFLPLGSLLYLDTYEEQLLANQEQSMIQQGRILSAALNGQNLEKEAIRIISNLDSRVDSRIRLLDARGNLLADSAVLPVKEETAPEKRAAEKIIQRLENSYTTDEYPDAEYIENSMTDASQTLLYRIMIIPVRIFRKLFIPPGTTYDSGEYYSGQNVLLGDEIEKALKGKYGAVTRISSGGQVSVNLYSAIPVWDSPEKKNVTGVVLISRSTYRILLDMYEVRLEIMRIFLISLLAAILISLSISITITRPLHKLRKQAAQVMDRTGRFQNHFTVLKRKDEIGALSRSLSELSGNLENRITFIDTFIADMLHELKNPLTAIRGAAEMCKSSESKEARMLNTILEEELRMERLLQKLREISRIDNQMDLEKIEEIDLNTLIPLVISRYPLKDYPEIPVRFISEVQGPATIFAAADRLIQVLTNPIDNGISFSPAGGSIEVILNQETGYFTITINDEGPGIREGSLPNLFNRFFSDRDESDRRDHSGLGLSIVKSIVIKYGGECTLTNREEGGATFRILFPNG
ncbi:MAG: HAMP domain-containing protein [Spirochaetales bacterium]|nr:HAMP domain-containing protein [Spirochaetales bacterium]